MSSKFKWIFVTAVFFKYCSGEIKDTDQLCKYSLDTCLKNVSVVLNNTKLNGIPKSKSDVDIVCKGFKIGMKCLDDYSKICLTEDQKKTVSDHIIGAKYTFRFLCDDQQFQKDYLKYTDCYRVINTDWDDCTNRFMSLIREAMNSNLTEDIKVLDLCCAKHGFLNCVYTTSKIKCGIEEAVFIRKIADTLSDNQLVSPICRHITLSHCNATQNVKYDMCIVVLSFLIIIWNNKT